MSTQRARAAARRRGLAKVKRDLWNASTVHYCEICGRVIRSFDECELDHEEPCGMGGGKRNDSRENLRLTHTLCNREKGSRRTKQGPQL